MAKADFYETLGVSRTADEKELKSAFRKLAMKWHPDKNPGDSAAEKKFKEINEAYEALKDPQKRAAYDRFGHAAFEGGGPGAGGGFQGAGGFSDIFEDIFGEMMGGGRRRGGGQGRERGDDLRYNMEISLEEAYSGKVAQIRVPSSITCDVCSGSGAKPGTKPATCATCHGSGRVRATQGFFSIERTCPTCQGRGQTISDPCTKCHGQGRVEKTRKLSVKVPPGVDTGDRIRLSGEGEAGPEGDPGAEGPEGPAGPQGDPGADGVDGQDGTDGRSSLYTDYGLNASVWGTDLAAAERVARRIHSGNVNVNDILATAFASKGTPSGGVKQSGVGARHGDQGLLKYTDVQNLAVLKKQVMGARPGQDYDKYVKGMLGGLRMMRRTGIR